MAYAAKHYYARGAGPVPLTGASDYNAFSKAMLGDEGAFGLTPEELTGYGDMWGTWHGQRVGAMPMAVALWRYVTPAHDALPSVHEVASGMWTPSEKEKKQGLGGHRGDFCTIATLVTAMRALANGGGHERYPQLGTQQAKRADTWGAVNKVKPHEVPGVADGSYGTAWRQIHTRLGAVLPAAPLVSGATATPYDYSCQNLRKFDGAATTGWPANSTAQKTWLHAVDGAKCKFEATPGLGRLSVWTAGDVARCEMDSSDKTKTVA